MNTQEKAVDFDFATSSVPKANRRSLMTMFMIMLGFTFFSASMWVGQQLAKGLDLSCFIGALILGGLILGGYTGALGFIGAESGLSLDLLAQRSFGIKGSYLPSAMISFTQAGWFGVGLAMFAIPVAKVLFGNDPMMIYIMVVLAGVCMTATAYYGIKSLTAISYIAVPCVAILGSVAMFMAISQGEGTLAEQFAKSSGDLTIINGAGLVIGSFVSGGSATPNFTRFAKNGKTGFWVTVVAFFIGNSLMFCFGAVSSIFVGGDANDIFDVMLKLGLFWTAVLVLGLNIWTTNDNALYTTGLGLANITGMSKKSMVLLSGTLGTVLAVWLYNNFCPFLGMLNATLPPMGIILILSYFLHREDYQPNAKAKIKEVEWGAVIGVIAGAIVANLLPFGIASINGMIVASICYIVGLKLAH